MKKSLYAPFQKSGDFLIILLVKHTGYKEKIITEERGQLLFNIKLIKVFKYHIKPFACVLQSV